MLLLLDTSEKWQWQSLIFARRSYGELLATQQTQVAFFGETRHILCPFMGIEVTRSGDSSHWRRWMGRRDYLAGVYKRREEVSRQCEFTATDSRRSSNQVLWIQISEKENPEYFAEVLFNAGLEGYYKKKFYCWENRRFVTCLLFFPAIPGLPRPTTLIRKHAEQHGFEPPRFVLSSVWQLWKLVHWDWHHPGKSKSGNSRGFGKRCTCAV